MSIWFPLRSFFRRHTEAGDWPPPPLPDDGRSDESRRISPSAAPVHVLAGTALVRVKEKTLIVERPGEPAFERPIELVSAVHLHGWGGVTSPAVAELLAQGAPVVWRGVNGYPIGCSQPMHAAGVAARRAQYAAAGGQRGLEIARALVAAKIVNMRGVARRKATIRGRDHLEPLGHCLRQARSARNLPELLGIEGAATARYFGTWPDLISDRAGDLEWPGRSRRPPRDIINALLSYLYALLAGEALCAVAAAGLDPRVGFLHQMRAGRPALALDLMEVFRPLIADQAVLTGLNTGQVRPGMFDDTEDVLRFTEDGRRLALELFEKRMAASVSLPGRSEPQTYRAVIGLEARALVAALRDGSPFQPTERA